MGKTTQRVEAKGANAAAAKQRAIQARVDAKQRTGKRKGKGKDDAVQAGPRRQPENPMPAQHLKKPGNEHGLDVAPRWRAPHYRGSDKLAGLAAIVTGGDSGIGRAVAVLFARDPVDEVENAVVVERAYEAPDRLADTRHLIVASEANVDPSQF